MRRRTHWTSSTYSILRCATPRPPLPRGGSFRGILSPSSRRCDFAEISFFSPLDPPPRRNNRMRNRLFVILQLEQMRGTKSIDSSLLIVIILPGFFPIFITFIFRWALVCRHPSMQERESNFGISIRLMLHPAENSHYFSHLLIL